jgi:DNA-binding CsgD family transcriptional regulator/tetratricopeptide (TPR) repeat protein
MARKSSQPHKRRDVYEEAQAAWARSDYDRVLELLARDGTARGRLLIAHTHVRLFDFAAARRVLRNFTSSSPEDFAEAEILRAYAEDCIGDSAQTFSTTALANLTLSRTAGHRVRAILAYYRAYALFNRRDFPAAYRDAMLAAKSTSSLHRAWGLMLLAWIEVTQKNFAIALTHFEQCIELLGGPIPIDELIRLNALNGFAFISVNMLNAEAIGKLVSGRKAFVSIPAPGRYYLNVQCHVAIAHALLGDDAAAFETLIGVLEVRERGPIAALPHIQLASLHRRRGSPDAAMLHFESARRIFDGTDWKHEDDEARMLLLHFAAEAAFSDRPAASRMFAKAMNSTGRKNLSLAFDEDGRSKALALYARGRIEAAAERTDDAVRDLTEARNIWSNIGYSYAAHQADSTLVALGARGSRTLRSHVKREFPRSWLASEATMTQRTQTSPLDDISEAEKRVVQGICEGLTSKEIAARVGRSPSTIKNQTISIYRTLGVNTRAALVALVMGRS